jgi:hypothetical protein
MANVRSTTADDTANGSGPILQLRANGRSFAAIATTLGYPDAHRAREAFLTALHALPEPARGASRARELQRLDRLASSIAAKPLDDAERTRLLRAVDRMRDQVRDDTCR